MSDAEVSDIEPEQESDQDSISESLSEDVAPGVDPIEQLPNESEDEECTLREFKCEYTTAPSSSDTESEEEGQEEAVIAASKFKGQSKGVRVPKENRTTPPFLTKYERARVIGTRALQISKNSPIYVDPSK